MDFNDDRSHSQGPSSFESMFRPDSRIDLEEDADDHGLFVTSLSRLAVCLEESTAPAAVKVPVRERPRGEY